MKRRYPFIHNSIALSRCTPEGEWGIEYFWRRPIDDSPAAFFVPDPKATWVREHVTNSERHAYYWLFGGFVVEDALFVGLLRVGDSKPRGPFRLPFKLLGMDLARIENFRDSPSEWKIQISTLSNNQSAFPASAFAIADRHVYIFSFFEGDGRSPRFLSRMKLDALRSWEPDLTGRLETLTQDSEWVHGFSPQAAKILMSDDATEMSVHFDGGSGNWIAVYSPLVAPQESVTTNIQLRTAQQIIGPWSSPIGIANIPAMHIGASRDPIENLFCYAAKAHPQLSTKNHLLVTYVCNLYSKSKKDALSTLERLQNTPQLYRPQALFIPLH